MPRRRRFSNNSDSIRQRFPKRAGWFMHKGFDGRYPSSMNAFVQAFHESNPERLDLLMQALIVPGDETHEGTLVEAAAIPWKELTKLLERDPGALQHMDWRKFEELIAGAYKQAGFDDVLLTSRSGDHGRDVVATKRGIGSIRIFDQVKRYRPGHLVTAEEVRAMLGTITGANNVSKGVITTTSGFAPGIASDPFLKPFMPFRLELKDRDALTAWLKKLATPD